jgi:hypothetical protein
MKLAALVSLVPVAVLAFACGAKDDEEAKRPAVGNGGSVGTGGSIGVGGSAGGIVIGTGGSDATGGTGGSAATAGTSGEIPMETADTIRGKSCAGWSSEPELLPTVLQLVVDTSFSMTFRTDSTRGRTKWDITQEALYAAVGDMPATAAVGVLYYPGQDTDESMQARDVSECINTNALIPIAPLGDQNAPQRERVLESVEDAEPAGLTPTHNAYDYALENGLRASRETGNRFMLLITDGAPTLEWGCIGRSQYEAPTQPIIDEIFAARQEGIRTFIIGSPGSEEAVNGGDARPWLSRAAALGGTARGGCTIDGPNYCHIDLSEEADFAVALNAALARILGQIVSCSFEIPPAPSGQTINLSQVNVIYTPSSGASAELVGRNDDPSCTDGWQMDAQGRVTLCENTCNIVRADPGGTVELLFGCDTQVDDPVK